MHSRFLARVSELPREQWNAMTGRQPFLRHEFLAALEDSGCVGARTGWTPRHLVLEDGHGPAAAAPLYLKDHSWGEFVFDFSWARAFEQRGLSYYPKLVCAVPFTPATGPRLLHRPDLAPVEAGRALASAMLEAVHAQHLSSAHALFVDEPARAVLAGEGWLLRRDCHFRWHNRGYRDFDDYLDGFSAEKRKKVRRERRRVAEQGIELRVLHAAEVDAATFDRVYEFHASTFLRHGHPPYLTRECFARLAQALPEQMLVVLALRGADPVAAALMFRSDDTLYGRYWGADNQYHSLHFETCYHQGIDYCIRHGIERFEPGTQGEHKLARGFEPVITWSAHWIADAPLRRAIGEYTAREGAAVDAYADAAGAHAPFRKAEAGFAPP